MDKITYYGMPGIKPLNKPLDFNTLTRDILSTLLDATHAYGGVRYRLEDVVKKNRKRDMVLIIQAYCYAMKKTYPKVILVNISKVLNYRDHTMSIHSIQTFQNLLDVEDPQAVHLYNNLKNTGLI